MLNSLMKDNALNYSVLFQLTQTFGPSGNEKRIADTIAKIVQEHADSVGTDPLGNLIVRKRGSGKKIMIASHMDEVGIIVTHINEKGFLYFAAVGRLKVAELPAKRVSFINGAIGIINQERKKDNEKQDKMYIDLGVSNEKEARKLVKEGDMAVLIGDFYETDSHIISKSLDNRLGCFVAIEVLRQIVSSADLHFVFTAQEEVGARGAKTAAYALEPDLAIIIDTTVSYDTPKEQNRVSLNQGVGIKVMDRSIVVSPQIKNWMADIAKRKSITHQWEIFSAEGTDSGPVHLSKTGIPTGGLAIPVRYLHSGSEIAAKEDIGSAVRLLHELLLNPFEQTLR